MDVFLHSVSSVSIIFFLTATGYYCAAKGWMKVEAKTFLSRFIMNITVPCTCFHGLTSNLTRQMVLDSGMTLLVPLIGIGLNFPIAYLAGMLLRLAKRQLGVFIVMCSMSNSLFIGYAMCTELFGDSCIPYVMLYYLVSTCFTQMLAVSLIRWSVEADGFSMKMVGKFLTSPAVLSVILGIIFVFAGWRLPHLAASYIQYMSDASTTVALILTGYIIYDIGMKQMYLDKCIAYVLIHRFLIAPALFVLFCFLFGVSGLMRSTFIIEAAMPVVTVTVVAAAEYGADEKMAARGIAVSTLACFAAVPLLMVIL